MVLVSAVLVEADVGTQIKWFTQLYVAIGILESLVHHRVEVHES